MTLQGSLLLDIRDRVKNQFGYVRGVRCNADLVWQVEAALIEIGSEVEIQSDPAILDSSIVLDHREGSFSIKPATAERAGFDLSKKSDGLDTKTAIPRPLDGFICPWCGEPVTLPWSGSILNEGDCSRCGMKVRLEYTVEVRADRAATESEDRAFQAGVIRGRNERRK